MQAPGLFLAKNTRLSKAKKAIFKKLCVW